MTYLFVELPAEALQAYAHTANFYYSEAYRNGIPTDNTLVRHSKEEDQRFDELFNYIIDGNLEALENSLELNPFNLNYREKKHKQTLLHVAYNWNQPKIVEFLLKKGANDRIPDENGEVPLGLAHPEYKDSSPTVLKELVAQCSQRILRFTPDIHILFDTTLDFIRDKKWTLVRDEKECLKGFIPCGDGLTLATLGLPHLSYRVTCRDLSRIFIKVVKHFGMQANEMKYVHYKSIKREERKEHNIVGQMFLFDESEPPESTMHEFWRHWVVYAAGWYFDLTLMCKYQDKDAILTKPN